MPLQFANLKVSRIIIHEIFRRGENREILPPRFSDELTNLTTSGINTLRERIIAAIGNDTFCMEMNIIKDEEDSTFQAAARLSACDDKNFITTSKTLALKLAEAQTSRSIPGGIIVIVEGTVGPQEKNYISIIKAEIHSGFSKREVGDKLSLEYIEDLLLTPQQKLYKIGMFIKEDGDESLELPRSPDEFKAFVYDHNMTRSETQQAARYFYEGFLGCSVSPSSKRLTRDFYNDTSNFIERMDIADGKKSDLHTGLYSYLKLSQSTVVEVSDFAEQYLEPNHRDQYSCYMQEEKGFPEHSVAKDLTYLSHKLRNRHVTFTSKVKISAPAEQFQDLVKVMKRENGRTIVSIEGQIQEQT